MRVCVRARARVCVCVKSLNFSHLKTCGASFLYYNFYLKILQRIPHSTLYPMDVQRVSFWDIAVTIRYPGDVQV